jgi:hypothetical protein
MRDMNFPLIVIVFFALQLLILLIPGIIWCIKIWNIDIKTITRSQKILACIYYYIVSALFWILLMMTIIIPTIGLYWNMLNNLPGNLISLILTFFVTRKLMLNYPKVISWTLIFILIWFVVLLIFALAVDCAWENDNLKWPSRVCSLF